MIRITLIASLLLANMATAQEFKPLFDGKSLDGWEQHGGKAKYRVEDGAIVGTSVPNTQNSFLCTTKEYGDFILELEFKVSPELNSGVQIHTEDPSYDHEAFRPWRVQALGFKAIRTLYPGYDLWRDFPYEYVFDKLAIDVINGGPGLREWVDDPEATPADLDALTTPDEKAWEEERKAFLLY